MMMEINLINTGAGFQNLFNYIYENHPSFCYAIQFDQSDPTRITEFWINSRVKLTPSTGDSSMQVYGYDENGAQNYTVSQALGSQGFKYYVKTNKTLLLSFNAVSSNWGGFVIDKSRDSNGVEQNEVLFCAANSSTSHWFENWGDNSLSLSTNSSDYLTQLVPFCSSKSTSYLQNTFIKFQGSSAYGKALFDDKSYYICYSRIAILET